MTSGAENTSPWNALRWLIGAIALVGTAWVILVVGMANQNALELEQHEAALNWEPNHAKAHLELGLKQALRDPERAENHLRRTLRHNPAEGRAWASLAVLHESRGQRELAAKAMEMATRLSPQRGDVHLQAAALWTNRGDYARAIGHLDTVLRHRDELRQQVFPWMLKLLENPANHPTLKRMLERPINWWAAFFIYATHNASSPQTLSGLFRLKAPANPLPPEALAAYLTRLQREKQWNEAWFTWANTLGREDLSQSGYVFNGSFERPISNLGFDWISTKTPAVVQEVAATYGTTGERALHLIFRGLRIRYNHLYQYLLLPPGNYQLEGRVRPEHLETAHGMRWAVYCQETNALLGNSESFRGSDQWTRFRAAFRVDEGCLVQILRLELDGKINMDFDVNGGIWFDDIAVVGASGKASRME